MMTTPDQPIDPNAPAPGDGGTTPPPDPTPPPPAAPLPDPTAGGGTPDAPPPGPGTGTPPDVPQVTTESTGDQPPDAPPLQHETDRYIRGSTSNETPIALPIEYEQYPTPPG